MKATILYKLYLLYLPLGEGMFSWAWMGKKIISC